MSNFLTLLSNQPQVVLFRNQAFYFTRSGGIHLNTGSLKYVGANSSYWPSTAYLNVNHAYYLDLRSADVYPSYHDVRRYGFLLRCIAS